MNNKDEFHSLAIQRQVKNLFGGRHFSICDVDDLAKLLGLSINGKVYRQIKAYHCVYFADMSDREKVLLQEKVVEALRGEPFINPARVLSQLTDEGGDFTFTEDRYIGNVRRLK